MPSIYRLIIALLFAALLFASVSAALASVSSSARPKTQNCQCSCACEYPDENGKWHWGEDVYFTSSNCYVGAIGFSR